jgi:hypothetical protein
LKISYRVWHEPRCLRWVQVKAEEAVDINGELIKFGYRYLDDEDATSMVEFHVDDVACWSGTAFDNTSEE